MVTQQNVYLWLWVWLYVGLDAFDMTTAKYENTSSINQPIFSDVTMFVRCKMRWFLAIDLTMQKGWTSLFYLPIFLSIHSSIIPSILLWDIILFLPQREWKFGLDRAVGKSLCRKHYVLLILENILSRYCEGLSPPLNVRTSFFFRCVSQLEAPRFTMPCPYVQICKINLIYIVCTSDRYTKMYGIWIILDVYQL